MASHSFINKSRAILICLLVVGALAEVSAYYYVQNNTSGPASSLAPSFEVANLTINPNEARLNQPVNISVGVANVGQTQGSYSLSLKINDTGGNKRSQTVVNETKIVTFSVTEANEGRFNVTVGDLVGLFSVSAKPANSQLPFTSLTCLSILLRLGLINQ